MWETLGIVMLKVGGAKSFHPFERAHDKIDPVLRGRENMHTCDFSILNSGRHAAPPHN